MNKFLKKNLSGENYVVYKVKRNFEFVAKLDKYKDVIQPYYSKIIAAINNKDRVIISEYLIKIYDEEIKYSDEFIEKMNKVLKYEPKRQYFIMELIQKFFKKIKVILC